MGVIECNCHEHTHRTLFHDRRLWFVGPGGCGTSKVCSGFGEVGRHI